MVYTSEDGHPSKYSPGPMLINFVSDYTRPPNTGQLLCTSKINFALSGKFTEF